MYLKLDIKHCKLCLDDLIIPKDLFDKTIEELEIADADVISIKRREQEDGTR